MSYKKADKILPKELLELIQQYVEGESIYIPRRTEIDVPGETARASGRKSQRAMPCCTVITETAQTQRDWQINTACL